MEGRASRCRPVADFREERDVNERPSLNSNSTLEPKKLGQPDLTPFHPADTVAVCPVPFSAKALCLRFTSWLKGKFRLTGFSHCTPVYPGACAPSRSPRRYTGVMELTREQMKQLVRLWEQNDPWLERVRQEDIRNANTQQSLLMFQESFRIALRDLPPRTTSGLVEWQRWMMLWRQRGLT